MKLPINNEICNFVYVQNIRIMTGTYNQTKEAAINALIIWVTTGTGEIAMRNAVNDFLEVSGANLPAIGGEETILEHRKIAVNRLAIDCIHALSKEELSRLDKELETIACSVVSVS